MFRAVLDVFSFEMKRALTHGRLLVWIALAGFPSALMLLVRSQTGSDAPPDSALAIMTYFMVVQVSCMLGLLLWATPIVASELEGQTWIYLATRQYGKLALVLGKYLVAVVWTISAGLISSIGVALICGHSDPWRLMFVLQALVCLGSLCFAGLYMAIGVLAFQRAMVIAVIFTLIGEGIVPLIPAMINRFTVSYRLRSLFTEWMGDAELQSQAFEVFGYESVTQHLSCMLIYMIVALLIALLVVGKREYPAQTEG